MNLEGLWKRSSVGLDFIEGKNNIMQEDRGKDLLEISME
jgi:hypothetical protein